MALIAAVSIAATTAYRRELQGHVAMAFLGIVLIFASFLISEEVFRNVRLGATLWSRRASTTD